MYVTIYMVLSEFKLADISCPSWLSPAWNYRYRGNVKAFIVTRWHLHHAHATLEPVYLEEVLISACKSRKVSNKAMEHTRSCQISCYVTSENVRWDSFHSIPVLVLSYLVSVHAFHSLIFSPSPIIGNAHLLLSCPVKFTHQTNHKSHNLDGDLNCDPFQTQVRQALRACKTRALEEKQKLFQIQEKEDNVVKYSKIWELPEIADVRHQKCIFSKFVLYLTNKQPRIYMSNPCPCELN